MKRFTVIVITFLFSMALFAQKKTRPTTKYYFVVGWEHYPDPRREGLVRQPVISNVFGIQCKEGNTPIMKGLQNNFNSFYTASFGKKRGFGGLNQLIAFGAYDNWEEAEKERRKRIADYNRDWFPILVEEFSSSCD